MPAEPSWHTHTHTHTHTHKIQIQTRRFTGEHTSTDDMARARESITAAHEAAGHEAGMGAQPIVRAPDTDT
jgi:hypothetical protein